VKDGEVANLLAVMADAESRSTAMLVELIVATALYKLAAPEGDAVVEVEISQGDVAEAAAGFFWRGDYDKDGTLKLRLSRSSDAL
jgi:hypothetical protein